MICPLFVDTHLSCLTLHQKDLSRCSFGCKNLLNFTWNGVKFCNHLYDSNHWWIEATIISMQYLNVKLLLAFISRQLLVEKWLWKINTSTIAPSFKEINPFFWWFFFLTRFTPETRVIHSIPQILHSVLEMWVGEKKVSSYLY